jgi:uncharacterized iron-regulated membrane protein
MKRLRSILFWCHLATGVAAGLVILIMSATGALIALQPQILNIVDRGVRTAAPSDRPRLPVSAIVGAVRVDRPDASVVGVTVDRDMSRSVVVNLERGGPVYVHPATGAVLGEGSARAQAIFRNLTSWHRYVGLASENRAVGKAITGAANLGFLLLAISGLYLWWPRRWSPQHTRAIVWFRPAATSRARDFNWHNVIGFWCAPAIIVMTLTATVISYPWANDLLHRLVGSEPPSATAARRPPERAAAQSRSAGRPLEASDVDRAWARAETQMPTWRVMTARLPPRSDAPVTFTISDLNSWNAFARSQLTVDAATGEIQRWQPYEASSLGQKARGWFRFAHTGELFGVVGQIVAGLGCLGGVVLVWTGLALAWRRLVAWRPLRAPAFEGRAFEGSRTE